MIRISIKFSHSDSKEGKYVIYFKNGKIHHRQNNYYQYNATENNLTLSFEFSKPQNCNNNYLLEINDYNKSNIVDLHKTSKDKSSNNFFSFMENIIFSLKENGKRRTSETYYTTLNSFKHFRNNNDLAIDEINSNMIQMYETYLLNKGLTRNSSSFYMRILRAVYNRAVEKELTANRNPFKHVYTGIDKTVKRAIPLNLIKQIRKIDLSLQPSLDFARDMFLFSFYTRGMSFIDMAYLKKKDLLNGVLSYRRHKTGQLLYIRWEKCMQEIVDKYYTNDICYLLPIIQSSCNKDTRKQYICMSHNINRSLKIIGKKLGITIPLTMYVSRHSWASIAMSKNIPLSIISKGLGHDSETTTRIYLSSLDNVGVDKANVQILKDL